MNKPIAFDFDGTVVQHKYPLLGEEIPGAVATLTALQRTFPLILWTMRSGAPLTEAVKWCTERGIVLHGINTNPSQLSWTSSPKAYAQLYIDDAALGCPLTTDLGETRPRVLWSQVAWELVKRGLLDKQEAQAIASIRGA